jgi:cellulose synthase/poly-beta-1,6-N-acetylglucosamine synthase-like glycosyltransferase
MSGMASGMIAFINAVLVFVVRAITSGERHETQTKHNVSVAFKLLVARFLNSSLVLVLINTNPNTWFRGGDLVYEASILIAIMAMQTPVLTIANPVKLIRWYKKRKAIAEGEECQLTQREANELCEGPPIDIANSISNYMNLICTCIFYSPIIPQAIPAALFGTVVNYWFSKYMLLRIHKMPEMFSGLMAQFFANLMPIIILIWAFSFQYFILSSKGANLKDNMIKKEIIK